MFIKHALCLAASAAVLCGRIDTLDPTLQSYTLVT